MADLDKVKRNIGRMVDQDAPEADIDAYIRSEGVTLDQVRAHKVGSGADQRAKATADSPVHRQAHIFQSALLPGSQHLYAIGNAAKDAVTGQARFGDSYTRHKKHWNDVGDEIEKGFGVTDAPARAAGWVAGAQGLGKVLGQAWMAPGNAFQNTFGSVPVSRYVTPSEEFLASVIGAVRPSAGFGAAQAGLDSEADTPGGQTADTLTGMVGGAVLGPAVPLVINALGRMAGGIGRAYRSVTGRSPDVQQRLQQQRESWRERGITEFPPAMVDSPIASVPSRAAAGSVFGHRLRRESEVPISDTIGAVRREIQAGTDGRPLHDVGEGIQNTLRDALVRRSQPSAVVQGMETPQLDGIMPVGPGGFTRPRPVVDPVPPREVPPMRPDPIDETAIQFEPVTPGPVKFPGLGPSKLKVDDVPYPQGAQELIRKHQLAVELADADVERVGRAFVEAARQRNVEPDVLWRELSGRENGPNALSGFGRIADDPARPQFLALREAYQKVDAARDALKQVQATADDARQNTWRDLYRNEYGDRTREAYRNYDALKEQEALRAQKETAARRQAAIDEANRKAEADVAARRASLEAQARADADAATLEAQRLADEQWRAEMARGPGPALGRSRESYPTEFDAAYERVSRETPKFQRNVLGGGGVSGSPYRTSTEGLLDDVALEGRRRLQLPGYKDGQVITPENDWFPGVRDYLNKRFGPEIAGSLDQFLSRRARNQLVSGVQGIRDLRTAVREAAEAAERPPYPGQPRREDAATLRRLEGALSDDMFRFMSEAGPQGRRAVGMWRELDAAYGRHIEEVRRPLSKLFGDNVNPLDAMGKVSKAVRDGDLTLLRPYMRVMMEKGGPDAQRRAVATVLADMSNNAATLAEFTKAMREIPQESRAILFAGENGQRMLSQLTALDNIAKRLEPYEAARKKDLANPTNIAFGIAALSDVFSTAVAAGGATVLSRFMASPRYMDWLLRGAKVSNEATWRKHVQQFVNFSDVDKDFGVDVVNAIKGSPARAAIVGERAFGTDQEALERAKSAGLDRETSRQKFGWFKEPDGQWRLEIDDSSARLKTPLRDVRGKMRLGDVLEHPALFKMYPGISDIDVVIDQGMFSGRNRDAVAMMNPRSGRIYLNPRDLADDDNVLGALMHEVQHVIQAVEGFKYGDRARYLNRPGEIEAYAVERRRKMTPEERRAVPIPNDGKWKAKDRDTQLAPSLERMRGLENVEEPPR